MLYLDDFLITFWDHNIAKRQLLLPWINISMANQAYSSPEWILTSQKETSQHIFKLAIFSKFFGDFMSHIIGWNAGKKIKWFFQLFINEKLINLLSDSFRIRVYLRSRGLLYCAHSEPASTPSLLPVWSLWGNLGMARCWRKSNLICWIHPPAQSTLGEQQCNSLVS